MEQDVISGFASRLSELCDEKDLPRERGRQTALAEAMGVTPNAARKWLLGEGLPKLEQCVTLANWGQVNVLWLIQGVGPKNSTYIDTKMLVLDEALHRLPSDAGRQVVEYLRYQVDRYFAAEQRARYSVMLDVLNKELANPASK
jgi:transcriptional regulator with XRE-family HTH domain